MRSLLSVRVIPHFVCSVFSHSIEAFVRSLLSVRVVPHFVCSLITHSIEAFEIVQVNFTVEFLLIHDAAVLLIKPLITPVKIKPLITRVDFHVNYIYCYRLLFKGCFQLNEQPLFVVEGSYATR
uniref:Uncharacterized protein n=1 Tax=Cacopsylla melanoneura TaxID=428564 RepID=A0A8D9BCE2_9HEMI